MKNSWEFSVFVIMHMSHNIADFLFAALDSLVRSSTEFEGKLTFWSAANAAIPLSSRVVIGCGMDNNKGISQLNCFAAAPI